MAKASDSLPEHPNRVIARAYLTGLSTTVQNLWSIKTIKTEHLYESSKKILESAKKRYLRSTRQGKPDFCPLTKAEHTIRSNALTMYWEKLAVFGNTEVHRVRNPNDTIGFANQILNRLGAVLRNLMVIWYTFPDPEELGTRAGSKGKQFRIMGYPKTYLGPEVSLIHSENPSWDFGDIYRNHLQLLGITCYIRDVPLDDISAYGHLFTLRIKPYLDYLYTEHRMGLQGFKRGAPLLI
jgi:hypothetical protein